MYESETEMISCEATGHALGLKRRGVGGERHRVLKMWVWEGDGSVWGECVGLVEQVLQGFKSRRLKCAV